MNKIETHDERIERTFREYGIFFRRPKTRFQRFMLIMFSQFKWCRWFLGGKWQGVVEGSGDRSVTCWHWMEQYMEKSYLVSYLENYDW